jgi:DNA modification methylase
MPTKSKAKVNLTVKSPVVADPAVIDLFKISLGADQVEGEHLVIRFVPLAIVRQLLPAMLWDRNGKRHDIGGVYESIDRFGFVDYPKWDKNLNGGKGGIVFGNGRTEAVVMGLIQAKIDGNPAPRGIPVSKEDGDWCIPIEFGVDAASEAQAQSLAIAHNNLTMSGSDFTAEEIARMWEPATYLEVLQSLQTVGELPPTVDDEAIEELLRAAAESAMGADTEQGKQERQERDADNTTSRMGKADKGKIAVRANPGDVWALGHHRICCGDSTDPKLVGRFWKEIGAPPADMIWTDPPYGVSYVGKTEDAMTIENDALSPDELRAFLTKSFKTIVSICKPSAPIYIAHPAGELQFVFYDAMVAAGMKLKQTLTWKKNTFAMGRSDYHYKHEPIYYAFAPGGEKGPSRMGDRLWYGGHNQTSVFEVDKPSANRLHPTMKPIELILLAMNNSSLPGNVLFEPYLGSGSTLIAGEAVDRIVHGFELSPEYFTVVLDRWEEFTGLRAKFVSNLHDDTP